MTYEKIYQTLESHLKGNYWKIHMTMKGLFILYVQYKLTSEEEAQMLDQKLSIKIVF